MEIQKEEAKLSDLTSTLDEIVKKHKKAPRLYINPIKVEESKLRKPTLSENDIRPHATREELDQHMVQVYYHQDKHFKILKGCTFVDYDYKFFGGNLLQIVVNYGKLVLKRDTRYPIPDYKNNPDPYELNIFYDLEKEKWKICDKEEDWKEMIGSFDVDMELINEAEETFHDFFYEFQYDFKKRIGTYGELKKIYNLFSTYGDFLCKYIELLTCFSKFSSITEEFLIGKVKQAKITCESKLNYDYFNKKDDEIIPHDNLDNDFDFLVRLFKPGYWYEMNLDDAEDYLHPNIGLIHLREQKTEVFETKIMDFERLKVIEHYAKQKEFEDYFIEFYDPSLQNAIKKRWEDLGLTK